MKLLCAVLFFAAPLAAQPAPPAAAANEDPSDVEARVRYERAVRAEFDGQKADAIREAQSCIAARPDGRFAEASRTLIERLHGEVPPAAIRSTGVGPRTELIITSTATGLYLSGLVAGAFNARGKESVGLLMAGTGGALLASIVASKDRRVPQSMPQMLQNGVLFGTEAILLGYAMRDGRGNIAGGVAAGVLGGAVAGLIASPWLTGGDSGAISTGILVGGALPALIAGALQGPNSRDNKPVEWAALLGSTAGIIVGPILNRRLHYSRGRWNLITLGGGVGALMGGGIGVLADAWKDSVRGGLVLTAVGGVAGLALMGYLTEGFGEDEPRPGSAALLHVEDGKLSLGSLPAAISPTRIQDKTATLFQLVDGRF